MLYVPNIHEKISDELEFSVLSFWSWLFDEVSQQQRKDSWQWKPRKLLTLTISRKFAGKTGMNGVMETKSFKKESTT